LVCKIEPISNNILSGRNEIGTIVEHKRMTNQEMDKATCFFPEKKILLENDV